MKKNIEIISAALFVVCGILASCAKENTPDDKSSGEETYTVNFIGTIKSEEPQESQEISKTGFVPVGDKQQIWWKNGDIISYCQLYTKSSDDKTVLNRISKTVEGESFVPKVEHSVLFNEPKPGTPVAYSSFFPSSSYVSFTYVKTGEKIGTQIFTLQTPKTQKPSATNYDPNADLLISDQEGYVDYVPGEKTFSLKYYRKVAIARMKVYGLPADEAVDSILIRATQGGKEITLAGQTTFDPTKEDVYGNVSGKEEKQLTLDYSGKSIKASGEGMTAFFCCYPFELGEGDKLSIVVSTASHSYLRDITLSEEQSLKLKAGQATNFSANMTGAVDEAAVLTIGSESSYYPTLEEAFSAASGKTATISLCKNLVPTGSLGVSNTSSDITLDLNGKTLTVDATSRLAISNGKLTIKGTGKISQETAGKNTIYQSGGELNIQNGDISSFSLYALNIAGGVANISGGSLSSTTSAVYAKGGALNISGGEIESSENHAIIFDAPSLALSLSVTGGKVISSAPQASNKFAFYVNNMKDTDSFTINGGDFRSNYSLIALKTATAKVEISNASTNNRPYFYSYDDTGTSSSASTKAKIFRAYNPATISNISLKGGKYGCATDETYTAWTINANPAEGYSRYLLSEKHDGLSYIRTINVSQ